MDLLRTIRELHEEKKRLDRVIASLEQLIADERSASETPEGSGEERRSNRGRRNMGEEERRQVSERMSRYWAERRAASAAKPVSDNAPGRL